MLTRRRLPMMKPPMPDLLTDDDAIAALARGVLDRSLPKAQWTHAAHFAATLWLLRHHPGFDGRRDLPAIIRAYNDATGTVNSDTSGYHQTITLASLRGAAAALAATPAAPLHRVLETIMAGPMGRSDWLLRHWSRDRLFSIEARREWLAPDLTPLPF
jgi:hypothetical protein